MVLCPELQPITAQLGIFVDGISLPSSATIHNISFDEFLSGFH